VKNAYPNYYPVCLNVSGRLCIVVGGGQVAARKAAALAECAAKVRIISPELCRRIEDMARAGQAETVYRNYAPGDLQGAFLTIAATDDAAVNAAVAREAESQGIPVNVVDDAAQSSFIVPSLLRRGGIAIAVSTSGMGPALARRLRERLEAEFGREYAALAELVEEVRAELKTRGLKPDGDAWQAALDLEHLVNLLRRGEREQARLVLLDNLVAGARPAR